MIDRDLAHDLMNRLVSESQKEMTLHFELRPLEAYLLLSLVQLATTHDDIPENPKEFGDKFIQAFCDRYREELPAMVQSFELADHENFLMSKDEFDDLTGCGGYSDEELIRLPLEGDVLEANLDGLIELFGGHQHDDTYVDDFE